MLTAAVYGVSGPRLSENERSFLKEARPYGLILFKRNIQTPSQVKALVDDFKTLISDEHAVVLIDQEGGPVQRLSAPFWPHYPAARDFVEFVPHHLQIHAAHLTGRLMAHELFMLGIYVNCAPVLDVPLAGTLFRSASEQSEVRQSVLGRRAFSTDPFIVAALGRAQAESFLEGGVLPVIKHIPGYGRADYDSHLSLSDITAPEEALSQLDFLPFRALADMPMGMVSHTRYTVFDVEQPATFSPIIIQDIIRKRIGFKGLLLSDALEMGALTGPLEERAKRFFAAGGDIALMTTGILSDSEKTASVVPILSGGSAQRMHQAHQRLGPPSPLDARSLWQELRTLFIKSDLFLPEPWYFNLQIR